MSISKKRGPTARQLQAEETKQLLINTANCLFNTYGFNAVGVRDIAASAGVSTGAFYHHFTSKEELVLYHSMKISDWFDTLTPDNFAGETCYEKLRDFCTSYLAGIIEKDGPETIHHILSLKKTSPGLQKIFLTLILQGQQDGEFSTEKTPEQLCDFLLACYRGAAYDWYRKDGKVNVSDLIWEHISYPLDHFRTVR